LGETGFAAVPTTTRFALKNANLPAALVDAGILPDSAPDGLFPADIHIADGRIERISSPGGMSDGESFDLNGGMVWPCFVDMHTHLDKGHIWPRRPNPDGSFAAALDAVERDRAANWQASDVARRIEFGLRCAYAHGTALMRTHLDSAAPQHAISWPVFADVRERWAGRVELQAASLFAIDAFLDKTFADEIVGVVSDYGGVLGAVTFMVPDLDRALTLMMERAAEQGLDLDFHVDETHDPAACSLRAIAEAAIRTEFPGRIVAGHCCSLAMQPNAEPDATLDRVAEAGIAVVSLPMCNLYLQDRRSGRTPRWRGVTLLHEMAARGIEVAVASDNTRDPFYAYGDLDMLEVFRESVRVLQLDHPIAGWERIVTRSPADTLQRPDKGRIAAGQPADLVLFRARNWTELLARPQSDRTVLRAGKAIDRTLPDYRELDDLMGSAA
jgi:cytosine deaminase